MLHIRDWALKNPEQQALADQSKKRLMSGSVIDYSYFNTKS